MEIRDCSVICRHGRELCQDTVSGYYPSYILEVCLIHGQRGATKMINLFSFRCSYQNHCNFTWLNYISMFRILN